MKLRSVRSFFSGIRVSPCLLAMLIYLFATDRSGIAVLATFAAVLHEIGHILAGIFMKIPLKKLHLDFLGARLFVEGRLLSYGEEWLLAASGPLMSLLAAAVGFLFDGQAAQLFSCASLVLGIINLLPIRNLDGGRMLSAFLSFAFSSGVADRTLSVLSFLTLFLLWASSSYLLLRAGNGISLFCFSIGLFVRFLEDGISETMAK